MTATLFGGRVPTASDDATPTSPVLLVEGVPLEVCPSAMTSPLAVSATDDAFEAGTKGSFSERI